MAPTRNIPLNRTSVNEAEPLPEPVRPSRRPEPLQIHRGKPPAKPFVAASCFDERGNCGAGQAWRADAATAGAAAAG